MGLLVYGFHPFGEKPPKELEKNVRTAITDEDDALGARAWLMLEAEKLGFGAAVEMCSTWEGVGQIIQDGYPQELALSVFKPVTRKGAGHLKWELRRERVTDTLVIGTAEYFPKMISTIKEFYPEVEDFIHTVELLGNPSYNTQRKLGIAQIIRAHVLGGAQIHNDRPFAGWIKDGTNITKGQAENISGLQAFTATSGPAFDWIRDYQ